MNGAQAIEHAIRNRPRRAEPALVAYLTAGFPSRDRFLADLAAVGAAADLVEIGVPFTDPMADGVTIQKASHAALRAGVTLSWILEQLGARPEKGPPVLLMSYLNPLLAFGPRLAARCAAARVAGLIVPDLPYEECGPLLDTLDAEGLALIQMVTPVTPPERLRLLGEAARGFVYAVTMTGTTGRNVAVPDEVLEYLERVRAAASSPVCAGFGIRTREQVARLGGHVDGVVVGSALVEVLERGGDPTRFLETLRHGAAA
jgi:tryptophan synthase alpha chain